ncbi:MAG: glycosyltransferase family 4 protein [Gammaproteobacteria bacterium]|nr:glycosyltransferase family 4 protein [Gammaproteobacteria bacterium]
MKALRLAIVVHGRFHAFDLAKALIRAGTDTTVFTNYPRSVAAKFGVPPERVTNCVWHGVATRLLARLPSRVAPVLREKWSHEAFGRWAARRVEPTRYDTVHCFSGVAEELWRKLADAKAVRSLLRGSAHIETQHDILAEEERLAGVPLDKPSEWMRAREQREYGLADQIVVLSGFARESFLARGVPAKRVRLVPLGSDLARFTAEPAVLAERRRRILAGEPLRVLTVGTWSHQKGVAYLQEIARQLTRAHRFRFVGAVGPDAQNLAKTARQWIEFRPRVSQDQLPSEYAWGDIFLFPTLQDGYAVVLAQAFAEGLIVLASKNCGAPELVAEGRTGWLVPIRDVAGMVRQLQWCDQHRVETASMVEAVSRAVERRDWQAVADDLLQTFTISATNKQ